MGGRGIIRYAVVGAGYVGAAFGLAACGNGNGPTSPPPPPPIEIGLQKTAVAEILSGFVSDNDALSEMGKGGSAQVMRAMAPKGFSPGVVGSSERLELGLSVIDSRRQALLGRHAGRDRTLPSLAGPAFSLVPDVPPEITCEWDVGANFWKLDPDDQFGPPPADGTRFVLYAWDESTSLPVQPLLPIDAYVDARLPQAQGTTFESLIEAVQDGRRTIDMRTSGTVSSAGADFGVQGGVLRNAVDEVLSFDYAWTESSASFRTTLDATAPQGRLEVIFDGLDLDVAIESDGQRLQIRTGFDTNFAIITSDVTVDGEAVAVASGSLFEPTFTLTQDSRLPATQRNDLVDIYFDAISADFGIFELVAAGGCLGSESPSICGLLGSSSN